MSIRKERWRQWGRDTLYFTEARGILSNGGTIQVQFDFRNGELLHAAVVGGGYSISSDGAKNTTHLWESNNFKNDD